jgi:hypothetical protein
MTISSRGVVLPHDRRPVPAPPAARYAVYALDDLTQIAFAGLADAVNTLAARGVSVPTALAASRLGDPSATGLCSAVEHALDDLLGNRDGIAAAGNRFHVADADVVDALCLRNLILAGSGPLTLDSCRRQRRLLGLGRGVAFLALLDQLRGREWPA